MFDWEKKKNFSDWPRVPSVQIRQRPATEAFEEARRRLTMEMSQSPAAPTTLFFRLTDGKKPLPGVELQGTLRGEPATDEGVRIITSDSGIAYMTVKKSMPADLRGLQIRAIPKDEAVIEFKNVRRAKRGSRKVSEATGHVLEVLTPAQLRSVLGAPRVSRPRKMDVALVGEAGQLVKSLPIFENHECFRIKKLFVDGKVGRRAPAALKPYKRQTLRKTFNNHLNDYDAVLVLSDNPMLNALKDDIVMGRVESRAILLTGGKELIQKVKAMAAIFEVPGVNRNGGPNGMDR